MVRGNGVEWRPIRTTMRHGSTNRRALEGKPTLVRAGEWRFVRPRFMDRRNAALPAAVRGTSRGLRGRGTTEGLTRPGGGTRCRGRPQSGTGSSAAPSPCPRARRRTRAPGRGSRPPGIVESRCVSVRYISSGSPPGRSTRPQPCRKSVSPDTNAPFTRKHCEPGVCPGVCRSSTSIDPDLHDVARRVLHEIALLDLRDLPHAGRFLLVHVDRDRVLRDELREPFDRCAPPNDPPTWSGW